MAFQRLFRSGNARRDKFLARLFGIISEEIVRCWARNPEAPYADLGSPTLKEPSVGNRGSTLDFTFRSKDDGTVYVVEMKCELEYDNYRYLVLESASQLDHHKSPAFQKFLEMTKDNTRYTVFVNRRLQIVHGTMLIWGSYTDQGRMSVRDHYGFRDVLSVESMISDLLRWHDQEYLDLLQSYENWCTEVFAGLAHMDQHIT
jgi:hypothetical protein